MTATLDETLAGHDMEGGEVFCDDLYNNLKNHWRDNWGGEPCGSAGLEHAQPGMIISDSYDDRLYHVIHASSCPCSEIVQTCIPVPDDVPIYFGYDFDGAIYYDELTLNEFMIEARNHADVEGVTINLLETNQRFRIRQSSDIISMYLDGTDVWFRWSDGELNLQTDELVNTDTIVNILGKGTGHGILQITGYEDIVYESALAGGGYGLRIDAYQDDTTALTGLLRGAYIQASNGDEAATGIIRALELKARAGRPGEVGADADHLEGLSISADAKTYAVGLARGAEFILDGGVGASITLAVGLRIAQNFQADIATTCYGLEFYWDSFEWDADIALASGGLIGGKAGHLRLSNTGVLSLYDAGLVDRLLMWHDGTDAFISWDNGTLNLQTDEADALTYLHIHGSGTGYGVINIYDEDDAEYLDLYSSGGRGYIGTAGATPSSLQIQRFVAQDIYYWGAIAAGNPYIWIYGWNTTSGALRYSRMRMDDVYDEFIIEAENHADHEGITISLLETNQRFRVRQNADYMAMYCTALDAYLTWSDGALNLQTEEADTNTDIHIHGAGTGRGILRLYDEGDDEWLELFSTSGRGHLKTGGVAPSWLIFQSDIAQDIRCWSAITAGNPYFYLFGWNTAAGTTVYSSFQMEDTYDEFFIEAPNSEHHEGITVSLLEAAQRFRVRGIAGAERFWVDEAGILGYTRVGELRQWTYQGDLADEASFTLPAFTDACWGFIQAGDNEEYALFSVDNDGDVTLISNSANVVAGANTDGKLCIGIAATTEPVEIRNRLGGTENINLIIWYS